jgi:hypothetical protein
MKPVRISLVITIIMSATILSTIREIAAQETRYRHDFNVSRHVSVTFTDSDVDSRLSTATSLLQQDDNACPDEVACCVSLNRNSSVTTFGASGDGLDVINNETEMNQVMNQTGQFKVVNEIRWCGEIGNFAGCARIGQPSAVVTTTAMASHWAHEFGHNQGLGHNHSCFHNIMDERPFGSKKAVNQSECTAFQANGTPDGTCDTTAIPTLSEWKQIFLTLLMLSLVMGFVPARSSRYNLNGGAISGIAGVNMIVFNKQVFVSVMKWIGLAVVLGLISAKVIIGHLSILDITGTFFCAPLVGYILHLMILCKRNINETEL